MQCVQRLAAVEEDLAAPMRDERLNKRRGERRMGGRGHGRGSFHTACRIHASPADRAEGATRNAVIADRAEAPLSHWSVA